MNGPHFRELLEIVCMTAKMTKKQISSLLGVDVNTVLIWQRKGVPVAIKPYVMFVLRSVLRERKHVHKHLYL